MAAPYSAAIGRITASRPPRTRPPGKAPVDSPSTKVTWPDLMV